MFGRQHVIASDRALIEEGTLLAMYEQMKLFDSLHRYAMFVGAVSCFQHSLLDGIVSLPFFTSVFYLACAHYGCSSRNPFARSQMRRFWQNARTVTLLRMFSLTVLSLLRIVFLSLHESKVNDTVAVFLAYIQLLIAFTDNLSLCCEVEESRLSRQPYPFRWNRRPSAASAA